MEIKSVNYKGKVAEIELSFSPNVRISLQPIIGNSFDAYAIFKENWADSKIEFVEEFKALFLNKANRVIGISSITLGGINHTIMDFRILFGVALKVVASGVIVAHNHPSGTLRPSESDIKVTQNIRDAGKLLGIDLIDHLIITKENYYSFKDNGAF